MNKKRNNNRNNHNNYQNDKKKYDILVTVGQDNMLGFVPETFSKNFTKKIHIGYVRATEKKFKEIIPLYHNRLEWDLKEEDSLLTVHFDNYEQFNKEMQSKLITQMSSKEIMIVFVIDTLSEEKIINSILIFPDKITVSPETNTLLINYHLSSAFTTHK